MSWYRFGALAALALVPVGCGGSEGVGPSDPAAEGEGATAAFELNAGPEFYGQSVKLCGKRVDEYGQPKPAGPVYACVSELPCDCYAFDPYGGLTVWDQGASAHVPAKIDDLCPSDNEPWAEWEFTFTLYGDATCGADGGAALNGGAADSHYVCWDVEHFYEPHMENKIRETLDPGRNENHVVCVTDGAD